MPAEASKETEKKEDNVPKEEKGVKALDSEDINILKRYGMGPYVTKIKNLEDENKTQLEKINKIIGVQESDTGLGLPSTWNLANDQILNSQHSLQVATCTKIINKGTDQAKYMITLRQIAKFIVGLGKDCPATDIDEGISFPPKKPSQGPTNLIFRNY
jgi:26S proteasome regulatory subunit T1